MNLLIDIGNTRLKWCCDTHVGLTESVSLDYRNGNARAILKRDWSAIAIPACVVIGCVGAAAIRQMVIDVSAGLWPSVEIIIAQTDDRAFGLVNGYRQCDALGVDRWLAMMAAYDLYQAPFCVVDCGTAITADIVDPEGIHQGGVISPGLALMHSALLSNTARLDSVAEGAGLGLAADTATGIANGVMMAAVGFIESLRVRLAPGCRFVLTGGDADAIAAHLAFNVCLDRQLVLKGLAMVSRHRKTS